MEKSVSVNLYGKNVVLSRLPELPTVEMKINGWKVKVTDVRILSEHVKDIIEWAIAHCALFPDKYDMEFTVPKEVSEEELTAITGACLAAGFEAKKRKHGWASGHLLFDGFVRTKNDDLSTKVVAQLDMEHAEIIYKLAQGLKEGESLDYFTVCEAIVVEHLRWWEEE